MKNLITMTVLTSALIAGTAFAQQSGEVATLFNATGPGVQVVTALARQADDLSEPDTLTVHFGSGDGSVMFAAPIPADRFNDAAKSALTALQSEDSSADWTLSSVSKTVIDFKSNVGKTEVTLEGKMIRWETK